jgi:hypothetical protein
MSCLKDLEMADAVSSYKHISIKKSLFGLVQKVIFTPTDSPVKVLTYDYSPLEGEHLEGLLNLPLNEMAIKLKQQGKPKPAPIGHFRLEVCASEDHHFCALQLFRYVDFKYIPAFEPRFYLNFEAETILKLF